LDLGIFAIQKMESRDVHPHLDVNEQMSKFRKMLCGFQNAATSTNVIDAFRTAGIMSRWDTEHRELVCFIDRENASEVRHWNQSRKRVALDSFGSAPSLLRCFRKHSVVVDASAFGH
jgi:hypothetical protein